MNEYERTPQDIEREIEATRERMSRDIDELGDRLSPDNLKRQAKDAITGKAHEMVSNVGAGARRTGFRMMDFIQENTSLVAAMGLGAVWLIQQRHRSEISGDRMARFAYTGPERRGSGLTQRIADRAGDVRHAIGSAVGSATETVSERAGELREQARDRAGDLAERAEELGSGARERARDLGHRAQEQTRRARGGEPDCRDAAGLLVPETERERRSLGPVRDDLAERAQTTASRIKDAAVEAGQEVKDAVQEEIKFRAPELKSTLSDAAQTVTQQVKESAGRVKEEAKQAAKQSSAGRNPTA
jgi:gas vesicle protein